MTDPELNAIHAALMPLLPKDSEFKAVLGEDTTEELETSWRALDQLGFEVTVGTDELLVRHPASAFERAIQLSRQGDLGELRGLFLALRNQFGRLRDRWLPWLFLPGEPVTAPYEHLRKIIGICQRLRQSR